MNQYTQEINKLCLLNAHPNIMYTLLDLKFMNNFLWSKFIENNLDTIVVGNEILYEITIIMEYAEKKSLDNIMREF